MTFALSGSPARAPLMRGWVLRLFGWAHSVRWPAWLFADEVTSALDGAAENHVYGQLATMVGEKGGALVSVAHRDSVARFHDRRWVLEPEHCRVEELPVQARGPAVP